MAADIIERNIKSEYIKKYRRYNLSLARHPGRSPNILAINDIYFTIEPQMISINEEFESMPITKLRRKEAIHIPSGYGEINVGIRVLLTEDYITQTALESELRYKLVPLLIQLDKNPLVKVQNSYLVQLIQENELFNSDDSLKDIIDPNEGLFAFVEGYTVSTVPNAPRTIALDLRLVVFNYKPYVPKIFYKHDGGNIAINPIDSLAFYKFFERDFLKNEHLASLATSMTPNDQFSLYKYTYIEIPSTIDISGVKGSVTTPENYLRQKLKDTSYAGLVDKVKGESKNLDTLLATAHISPNIPEYVIRGIVHLHSLIPNGIGVIGLRRDLADALKLDKDFINRMATGHVLEVDQINFLSVVFSKLFSMFNSDVTGIKKSIMAYYTGTTDERYFIKDTEAMEFYHQVREYKRTVKQKYQPATETARQIAFKIAKQYPHIARIVFSRKHLLVLQLRERVDLSNDFMALSDLKYSTSFHIARMMTAGSIFPTLQYMGVWDRELELGFEVAGDAGLANYKVLTDVLHETQRQYAQSRYFASLFGNEIINNFVNNVLRANNFTLRSIDSAVSSQRPNITQASISFTDTTSAAKAILGTDKVYYGSNDVSDKEIIFSLANTIADAVNIHYDHEHQCLTFSKNALIFGTNDGDLVEDAAEDLCKILESGYRDLIYTDANARTPVKVPSAAGMTMTINTYNLTKADAEKATKAVRDALKKHVVPNYGFLEDLINFSEKYFAALAETKQIGKSINWVKKYDLDRVRDYSGVGYGDMDLSLDENPDDMFVDFKQNTKMIREKMLSYARSLDKTQYKNYRMAFGSMAENAEADNTLLRDMFEEANNPLNLEVDTVAKDKAVNPYEIAVPNEWDDIVPLTNSVKAETANKTLAEITNLETNNKVLADTPVGQISPESAVEIKIGEMISERRKNFDKNIHYPQHTLRRAFPAYKVYIVEDDFDQILTRDADDLFELNTIQEIRIIKSREISADLAIVKFYDVTGYFTSAKFYEGGVQQENKLANDIDTERENPFHGIMLKEGVKIHIRLGYDNDANKLTPVFTGVITGIENDGATVTMVAQSHAIELVSVPLGDPHREKDTTVGDADTQEILYSLICRPEIKHFGRYKGFRPFGYELIMPDGTSKYIWAPAKYTNIENIFAPATTPSKGLLFNIFKYFDDIDFYYTGQTVWDVFQEMTLRHPGFIAIPRYYEASNLLMTMYFGLPSGVYFYRDKTFRERYLTNRQYTIKRVIFDPKMVSDSTMYRYRDITPKTLVDWSRVKPITSNHAVVSGINLIKNNIHANIKDVYTEVRIYYPGDDATIDLSKIDEHVDMKLDDNLYREDVRKTAMSFGNCVGEQAAYLYGTGVLLDMARHMYEGELIIHGDPTIEPFDTVFLTDTSTNTSGPLTVRQVEHVISPTDGFITVITPDMVAHPNDLAYMSNMKAAWTFISGVVGHLVANTSWDESVQKKAVDFSRQRQDRSSMPRLLKGIGEATLLAGGAVFIGVAGGFSTAVLAIGASLFGWSQLTRARFRHPIVMTPMLKSGIPYIYGVDSMKINGLFTDIKLRLEYWHKSFETYKGTYLSPQNITKGLSLELGKNIFTTITDIIFK